MALIMTPKKLTAEQRAVRTIRREATDAVAALARALGRMRAATQRVGRVKVAAALDADAAEFLAFYTKAAAFLKDTTGRDQPPLPPA